MTCLSQGSALPARNPGLTVSERLRRFGLLNYVIALPRQEEQALVVTLFLEV